MKNNKLRNVIIAVVAGIMGTCLCLCLASVFFAPSASERNATKVAQQGGETPAEAATDEPAAATKTPKKSNGPTETSAPTDTPEPTETFTPAPAGESRDNPVLAGQPIDLGGDVFLTVVGAVRPADSEVRRGNTFNEKPDSGYEYLRVDVEITCQKDSSDKCSFTTYGISAVGADGDIRELKTFLAGVDGVLDSGEFFGGGKKTGKLFFIVTKDDPEVVLFYDAFFGSPVYFALP